MEKNKITCLGCRWLSLIWVIKNKWNKTAYCPIAERRVTPGSKACEKKIE